MKPLRYNGERHLCFYSVPRVCFTAWHRHRQMANPAPSLRPRWSEKDIPPVERVNFGTRFAGHRLPRSVWPSVDIGGRQLRSVGGQIRTVSPPLVSGRRTLHVRTSLDAFMKRFISTGPDRVRDTKRHVRVDSDLRHLNSSGFYNFISFTIHSLMANEIKTTCFPCTSER